MNIKNNKNCKITINDEEIEKYTIKPETADKMFEKLGYDKIRNDKDFEVYRKNDYNIIDFERNDKRVYKSAKYDTTSDGITMQELKAINEKVRELRLDIMNKCKYLTIRTKNYEKYFYCRLNKKIINYTTECIKCVKNEPRKNKGINKISKKKITVTQDTYNKVMQRDNYKCRLCGTSLNLHLHHIMRERKRLNK